MSPEISNRWAIRNSISVNAGQFGIDDLNILRAALAQFTGATEHSDRKAAALRRRVSALISTANAKYEEQVNA